MVSVVILNYNNKDFLRQGVASALAVDWPALEVIVVDNASSDGSPEMVEAEFGDRVRLIRRQQNSPTAGRNQGFNAAQGAYILSLDNDIVLTDPTVVRKAVALFTQFPRVAALAFKIGTVENPEEPLPEHWWYPVSIQEGKNRFFPTDFFSEGAVFFRADAIRTVGGYDEAFFQYFEGNDMVYKLLRGGFDLLYCPNLSCGELRIRGFLYKKRTKVSFLGLRNSIWIVWKYYPIWRAVPYLLGRIALSGFRSVRYGWFDQFVKGVTHGLFAPEVIRAQRHPLNREIWKRIKLIHLGTFVDVPSRVMDGATSGQE
ncbi:MAG: glycosyltransferase [Acidobacteriia bacterium]|nr:glycosyltransferase [Terriglobia bacterium]